MIKFSAATGSFTERVVAASTALSAMDEKVIGSGAAMLTASGYIAIAVAVIAVAAAAFHAYKKHLEDLRRQADESREAFDKMQEDISGYQSRIAELKEQLEKDDLSHQDAYNIRSELLGIQGELVDAYGAEAGALDVLGDSATITAQKLEQLIALQALKNLDENEDVYDKARKIINGRKQPFGTYETNYDQSLYLGTILADKEMALAEKIAQSSDRASVLFSGTDYFFSISADNAYEYQAALNDIYDTILQISDDTTDGFLLSNLKDQVKTELDDVNAVLDEWGPYYNDWLLNKIASDDVSREVMNRVNGTIQGITDALAGGDLSEIEGSLLSLDELKLQISENDSLSEEVKSYMIGQLDRAVAGASPYTAQIELKAEFEVDPGLKTRILDALSLFKDEAGNLDTGLLGNMSLGFDEGATSEQLAAFSRLSTLAESVFGMGIMDFIGTLRQLGLVAYEVAGDVADSANLIFSSFGEALQSEAFTESVNQYITNMGDLQGALETLDSGGEIVGSDYVGLIEKFPRLAGHTDDLREAIVALMAEMHYGAGDTQGMVGTFQNMIDGMADPEDQARMAAYALAVLEVGENALQSMRGVELMNDGLDDTMQGARRLRKQLSNLWDSSQFREARADLESLANGAGIAASDILELAEDNEYLAALLDESGVSAQLLAVIFDELSLHGSSSLSLITDDAMALSAALFEMEGAIGKADAAYEQYSSKLGSWEYDDQYNRYQEAYAKLGEMFESDVANHGADFFRTIEYLFGEGHAADDIDALYQQYQKLGSLFAEDDNGLGFLEQLYNSQDALANLDSYVRLDESGNYIWDIKPDDFAAIADAFGITEEAVASCVQALGMFGDFTAYDPTQMVNTLRNLDMAFVDSAGNARISKEAIVDMLEMLGLESWQIEQFIAKMESMGGIEFIDAEDIDNAVATISAAYERLTGQSWSFDVDSSSLTEAEMKISALETFRDSLLNSDGSIQLGMEESYDAASVLLAALYEQKQALIRAEAITVDLSELEGVDEKLKAKFLEYQQAAEELRVIEMSVGIDPTVTEEDVAAAREKLEAIKQEISGESTEVQIEAELGQTTEELLDGVAEGSITITATEPEWSAEFQQLLTSGEAELVLSVSVPDTTALDQLQELINSFSAEGSGIDVAVSVSGQENLSALQTSIGEFEDKTVTVTASTTGKSLVDALNRAIKDVPKRTTAMVNAVVNGLNQITSLYNAINRLSNKTVTVTTRTVSVNAGGNINQTKLNGTAHLNGSAFAWGHWGIPRGTRALMGELGPEIYVDPRTSTYHTVGQYGAEFVNLPQGAIVFNHRQTEALMQYGYVSGRGAALATGTVSRRNPATGNYYTSNYSTRSSNAGNQSSKSSNYSSAANNVSATSTEAEAEELDWISVLLERLDRQVQKLDDTFSASFRSITERTRAGRDEIEALWEQYRAANAAAEAYLNAANSVSLDEYYKRLARDGAIRLDSIADEDLKKAISQYQDYLDKYYDALDTVSEALTSVSETHMGMFELLGSYFDHVVTHLENAQNRLNTELEMSEALGQVLSRELYDALIRYEEEKIDRLQEQLTGLTDTFAEVMASGMVQEYSDDWYDMRDAIDEVRQALLDSQKSIIDYRNSIVELFERIPSSFDSVFTQLDHYKAMFEKELEIYDYMAHWDSGRLFEYLVMNERERLSVLDTEIERLSMELQSLMDGGLIEEYSARYYEYLNMIQSLKEEAASARLSINQYQQKAFSSIESSYASQLNRLSTQAKLLSSQMSVAEARGYIAGRSFYEAMIRDEETSLALMREQKQAMQEYMDLMVASGELQIGSSQWYEWQSSIDAVTASLAEGERTLASYEQSLRKLQNAQFDQSMKQVGDMNDEAGFLLKLMEYNNDLVNTWDKAYRKARGVLSDIERGTIGAFTEEGIAALGLHAQEYATYMELSAQYAAERAEIEARLAQDPYNQELLDRRNELLDAQRKAIENTYSERDALVKLVKEGIDEQLKGMSNLIDSYKDALDSAKDLYAYQNKVDEQSNKIAQLRKQLAAYAGDDSEETRKTVQKLRDNLAEAEKDLEETQYDQYISDQKKLLDQLYDDYELNLNARLDDVDGLIENLTNVISVQADNIWTTLQEIASGSGYEIDNGTASVWTGISDRVVGLAWSVRDGTGILRDAVTESSGAICDYVDRIYHAIEAQQNEESARNILSEMQANSEAWWNADEATRNRLHRRNTVLSQEYTAMTGKSLRYDSASGAWLNADGSNAYTATRKGSRTMLNEATALELAQKMKNNSKKWTNTEAGKKLAEENVQYANRIAWLTGTPVYRDSNGVWWFGDEELYSRFGVYHNGGFVDGTLGDNEVFAKLLKGELVLTEDQVNALVHGNHIARQTLNAVSRSAAPKEGTASIGTVNVRMDLPDVRDYDDFMRRFSEDPKAEKWVRAVTVDLVAGKSSLEKTRYRW